jgi:hemerythrin-like domain-containing protein
MTPHIHANDDATRHPPDDAIAMLTADHRQVRALFQQYADTPDLYLRQMIAEHVCTALERHTYREDTVLYAAFAVATDAAGEMLIGEAFRAHQLCTCLLEDLGELAPDDARFARRWDALWDQIEQHMAAEERELFPQAARLLAPEMEEITAAMLELQEPLLVS